MATAARPAVDQVGNMRDLLLICPGHSSELTGPVSLQCLGGAAGYHIRRSATSSRRGCCCPTRSFRRRRRDRGPVASAFAEEIRTKLSARRIPPITRSMGILVMEPPCPTHAHPCTSKAKEVVNPV